jgi:hypothetical protein
MLYVYEYTTTTVLFETCKHLNLTYNDRALLISNEKRYGPTPELGRFYQQSILHIVTLDDYDRILFYGATATSGPGPPHFRGLTIILRYTILGRTSLYKYDHTTRT